MSYPRLQLLVLVVGLLLVFLLGCSDSDYSVCEFTPGQMVRSKVSGEIGQVIAMQRAMGGEWCYADVRFQGSQEVTNSRVLSDDGPISVRPLQVVKMMRPYELEHVRE